jgi:hypothetical protein
VELTVVRGNPTPEELAAALAVVRARAVVAPGASAAAAPRTWADPAARLAARHLPAPAPASWRTTYWPR